jgi:hypothetical protein
VNETAERAFIQPEAGRVVEPPQAGAAGGANALVVKWICVDKRYIARRAKVLRIQRDWGIQAGFADRNPGPFGQRALANAAIVGEKQRKNSMGDPANEIEGSRSR